MRGMIHSSYWLGVSAAALALVYKALLLFGIAASWPEASGVMPRHFLHAAVLLLVLCLATDTYARNRTSG